jgi:hypothetical protein
MLRRQSVTVTPALRVFINKVITPVVLVAGVLILILFNFRTVLKDVQTESDQFSNQVAFSSGSLAYRFKQIAGGERPALLFNGSEFMTYVEWNSTISVDGEVQELWNSSHGYSYDETRRQVFNTISGSGWQLIQVITLVDDHTVTVKYSFVSKNTSSAPPKHYIFDFAHTHSYWYNSQVNNNNTFTAQTTQTSKDNPNSPLVSLKVEGDGAENPQIKLGVERGTANPQGGVSSELGSFTTEYTIDNPTPNQIISLGTETIIYNENQSTPTVPSPTPVTQADLPVDTTRH